MKITNSSRELKLSLLRAITTKNNQNVCLFVCLLFLQIAVAITLNTKSLKKGGNRWLVIHLLPMCVYE